MHLRKSTADLYAEYKMLMQKIADIRNASNVLQWDQETYLPGKGNALRGQQIATLSEIAHRQFTEAGTGELLNELAGRTELDETQQKNIALSREDFLKQQKLTPEFVRAMSEAVNIAFHAWVNAKKENHFETFAPSLNVLVTLKKQEAEMLGYEKHLYDAHLDAHEKGCTVEFLDPLFGGLKSPLKQLLNRIQAGNTPDDEFLRGNFPKEQQWDFGMDLIRGVGFDLEAGRQDISEHPFTTSFNSNDVRITTRINEKEFSSMTWSCLHEAGHALYEQGLPESEYGLPLGEFTSLGIHESQSRLWENNVGRSAEFCRYWLPQIKKYFPLQLGDIEPEKFYAAINKVQPSLIRTEADELTYHFHVMIRYELEKKLLTGEIDPAAIPSAWNESYRDMLGVTVPDDRHGCLQDVHWSHGSFGYFPTYSLGSLYAAQFYAKAEEEIPELKKEIQSGHYASLLQWLRKNIHRYGRKYTSDELCRRITGKPLDTGYLLDYLLEKYRNIYKL